jgi:Tetratricopeptide repeat
MAIPRLFVALSLALAAGTVNAQPASDLLQSAIYNEEALGNPDAAIRIYRQILSSPDLKVYAAQAQYRLGICLLRQGDVAGGRQELESVIRNYPGERELAARARESLPAADGLLPAPWRDDEVAEYRWTIPGAENAWMATLIHSTGESGLRLQTIFYNPNLFFTVADVDPRTMAPIAATYRLGGRLLHRDYPQGAHAPATPRPAILVSTAISATVTGTAVISVPAGAFECYRVQVSGATNPFSSRYSGPGLEPGDTLWYGVHGARPLVKIERSGTIRAELASLGTAHQTGTRTHLDPRVGYSFTVPAGWIYHPRLTFQADSGTSVDLVDPDSHVWAIISAKPQETAGSEIQKALEAGADQRLAENTRVWRDYTVRPGSRRTWLLGGRMALTWIADYTESGAPRVEYITWVQSESVRAMLAAKMDASDFEQYRPRFDAMLNSFRIP